MKSTEGCCSALFGFISKQISQRSESRKKIIKEMTMAGNDRTSSNDQDKTTLKRVSIQHWLFLCQMETEMRACVIYDRSI